ncbi:MAG: twin-arginine translocase subunit TatC [Candidatus Omnitrophica bacterium]|nr:twin-arginine translocase subunit TatC [Candidatus Omnitrophota bacterium]
MKLTFFEHLGELRKRILISLFGILAAALVAYVYSDRLLAFVVSPLRGAVKEIYFFSPPEAFVIKVKLAILGGVFLALPLLAVQLWLFVSPALYGRERKLILPLAAVTSLLFLSGAAFCFFLVMPVALKFLIGMQSDFLKPMISMGEYTGFLSGMVLAFGVTFNLPLFILAAVFSGFLSARTLNRYQRHAIVLIFIAAAVMTPGPDVASQLFLAVPLLLLFELSVGAAMAVEYFKKRKKVPAG